MISINWNGVSYLMFLSCKQHFSSRNLWLSNLSIFHFLSKSILRHHFNRNSLNLLDFWILHMFQIKISRVKIKINPFLDLSKSTRQFIIKFSLVLTWFYEKCWIFLQTTRKKWIKVGEILEFAEWKIEKKGNIPKK